MITLSNIPIEQIRHRPDARHRGEEALVALTDSIERVGLLQPIRVRQVADGYEVVAGGHRLQACELLGWTEISCIVVKDDDLHAELAMIDENLVRTELSPAERAKQTARRKAIYTELHPETTHGGNLQGAGVANFATPETPSFAKATAQSTGKSELAVRLDVERGEKISPEVLDLVQGSRLDRGSYLDKLKSVPLADQIERVQADLAAGQPLGSVGGRHAAASPSQVEDVIQPGLFDRFVGLCDQIEALSTTDLIADSGRERAVLGQRASGLSARMAEILEGLGR